MCGFVGILDPAGVLDLSAAVESTRPALSHRGPDGTGRFLDQDLRCILEHHRLATFDPRIDGRQPMASSSDRFTMVFNGSIFDHEEHREDLEKRGTRFRTRTDTEVLLEGFETWGVRETLHRVDGMFAIGIVDRRERRLILARDRAGQKPLLIARVGGTLAFASDLRALEALPSPFADRLNGIDQTSLRWFLRLGVVPWPRSIRPGVEHLEPGGLATFDLSTLHATRASWWTPPGLFNQAQTSSRSDDSTNTIEILRESVHRQCRADRPVGVMLSGGLDSRLVATLASEVLEDLPCFTLAMPGPFDESEAAADVVRRIGGVHHVVRPTDAQILAEVRNLPAIMGEPFADSSLVPTTILARAARERIVVALGGDGGDEVFGGYRRHQALWRAMQGSGWAETALLHLLELLPDALTGRIALGRQTLRDLLRRRRCVRGTEVDLLALRSLQGDAEELLDGSDLPVPIPMGDVRGRAKEDAPPWDGMVGPIADVRSLMRADFRQYLPDDPLLKVDAGGMSVALEYRAPLLGRDVLAHASSIPTSELFDEAGGRLPIRRALRSLGVDPGGAKRGFAAPLARWLRGPLRSYAGDLLSWDAPDPLSRTAINDLWSRFLLGRTDCATAVWTAVSWRGWLWNRSRIAAGRNEKSGQ